MIRNYLSSIFFIFFLVSAFILGCICFVIHNHIVNVDICRPEACGKPSILLDESGREWARFQTDKRKYVPLETMPNHLIDAFLVTEDRNFFNHPGISIRGIIRSMIVNLWRGKKVQGASTITQQLVRSLYFNSKKTFSRKIKEQIYAILMERQLSKEQILEAYLNNVYFGYGIYGVQAAAQRFWGIDIADLSFAQSATLASIMRSPYFYSPINFPDAVTKRRNLILQMMNNNKMMALKDYQQSIKEPLSIKPTNHNSVAPHLKELIRIFIEHNFGREMLYHGGLTIATTINIDMQIAAEKAFYKHIQKLKDKWHECIDGAMVTIDSESGEIRVMIGGFDFKKSKFNRATQAYRQMGSVFKVFVYGAALEQGLTFSDVEIDEPMAIEQSGTIWEPDNSNKQFLGAMTRAYALSHSNNIVTIKTMLNVGIDRVIDFAKRCRISSELPKSGSLALGCVEASPIQVVGTFNTIVNHGNYVAPFSIRWIKDDMGTKIYKHKVETYKSMSPKIASQLAQVLTLGIERLKSTIGTKWFGGAALGKTGTNNDSRTCWFCGATPHLTSAIYIGCDQNQSLGKNVFGSNTAFPIWFNFHKQIENPEKEFYYDPSLHEISIDWKTGKECNDIGNNEVVKLLV